MKLRIFGKSTLKIGPGGMRKNGRALIKRGYIVLFRPNNKNY